MAILDGRISVGGTDIAPRNERIKPTSNIFLDGLPLPPPPPTQLVALHKPRGVLTTCDQSEPMAVMSILADEHHVHGLSPIGRLDQDTEGLLLLTNDGTLAKLLLERGTCSKTYVALVEPRWSRTHDADAFRSARDRIECGIPLANGYLAQAARCRQLDREEAIHAGCDAFEGLLGEAFDDTTAAPAFLVEVIMRQGAKREVRRLLKAAGYRTLRLCRVAIGSVRLGDLAEGDADELGRSLLLSLYAAACNHADAGLRAMPTYDDDAGEWVEAHELAARVQAT